MKKRITSLLVVLALCVGMLPAAVLAAENTADTAKIVRKSLTLSGILGLNFYVDKNNEADLSGYIVETRIEGQSAQTISTYTEKDGLYIFTADLAIKNLYKSVSVTLKKNGTTIQEGTFLFADYISDLKALYPTDVKLQELVDALADYGTYAAYYAAPTDSLATSETVESVQPADLESHKHTYSISKEGRGLNAVVSLYLDSACDMRVKFNAAAFDGCVLTIDGTPIPRAELTESGECLVWTAEELLPQDWDHTYHIVITRDGQELIRTTYSVLSYVYAQIKRQQEAKAGLHGLLKAMYRYNTKADNHYIPADQNQICINYADNGDGTVTATFSVNGNVSIAALEMNLQLNLTNAAYESYDILVDSVADANYTDGHFIVSLYMPETDLTEPADLFSVTFTGGAENVGIAFAVIDSAVSDGTFTSVKEVNLTGTIYNG